MIADGASPALHTRSPNSREFSVAGISVSVKTCGFARDANLVLPRSQKRDLGYHILDVGPRHNVSNVSHTPDEGQNTRPLQSHYVSTDLLATDAWSHMTWGNFSH